MKFEQNQEMEQFLEEIADRKDEIVFFRLKIAEEIGPAAAAAKKALDGLLDSVEDIEMYFTACLMQIAEPLTPYLGEKSLTSIRKE